MGFAQNLAVIMKDTNTSMYRLANAIGVHQTTVKNWLSGEREPKIDALKNLAEYFNISYDTLLGEPVPNTNVLRKGPFEFSDDGTPGHTLVSIGPQMRDGVLYLPDELLYTFAHLNKTAIETVCEVAEGLSKLDHCQRQADPSDPYDQLMGEYKNRIGDN